MSAITATHVALPLDRISSVLADLGDDPDQIADIMWVADARGRRSAAADGPLSRYLRRRLHLDAVRVGLGAGRVVLVSGDEAASVPLPAAVREFVGRFEQGLYPELEVR